MDLLNETRLLIHTGKLLQQRETGFGWNRWTELFILLFDNYFVMTKPKERDGVKKYQVYQQPIPLGSLTLASFTDPPVQCGSRLLPFGRTKTVYPCTISDSRLGGLHTLFAESPEARLEWKAKFEEAIETWNTVHPCVIM